MKNSFFAIFLASNCYAFSQTDSVQLKAVTITDNRSLEIPISSLAKSVNVLQKTDLKSIPQQSLPEILNNISGVDVRQRGPIGVQADIGIRGGSFDQTLILLNGFKLNDPQTGHHVLNVPIVSEALEKVEVIKGSAARTFGSNAFSGAVNFVTRVPDSKFVSVGLMAGDFGLYSLNAFLALPGESFGQSIGISKSSSSGFNENSDFDIYQAFYQSKIKVKQGNINFLTGYVNRNFGAKSFYVPNSKEFESIETSFMGLNYELQKGNWYIKPQIYWRYNFDDYRYLRERPDFFRNRHFTNVYGAELHSSYKSKLGKTALGFEFRHESILSNNLGERERNNIGLFAEHKALLFNKVLINPGIYLNWFSDYQMAAYPGLDVSYNILKNWHLYGNAEKALRLPTYTDLYYKGRENIGNDKLLPEEAISYELGLKYQKNNLSASMAYFNRTSNNLIDWIKTGNAVLWQPQNLNKVFFDGFEAEINLKKWMIFSNLYIGYTYINAEIIQEKNYLSRYSLSHIRNQVVTRFENKIYKNFYSAVSFRYVERIQFLDYSVTDLKIGYRRKNWDIYTEATNVFNTEYLESGFVEMPLRWFRVGVNYKFNLHTTQ